ncbi:T7SS effector LXG polymorphic toxin [Listeria cossartiae subsp. cayugensis]|nr:T7SS effector LXG polymorphic toxin [Listeria cossartiae]MDT0004220.1 T7SS effector LXG polymorphic toxin [Listeria cossartiae subsp. cayugensis]MDT0020614.1 T7SS effector LXG polymorphic toxin [Listeria cossartiae subsp. cayugensis]MDT0036171.1 T7SS effector LXG polymorphic toxin [Listeria cossartiae subsp. cayugensis]MDT0042365.1 T7SS effector LXG polymorphic toxin [Listeria cossartiae subsp. cayugensis]MDT0047716.1 T7SS effector LXG polymorphic toxin [Listeria cossartiae subsp. cayugensi
MSRIDIGEIQTFAYQLHTANETAIKSIKDIKKAVKNYTEDGSLKGKAVDASKNYYQMTYFPLCDAIIEAMNESEERLAQYIADFHAQVDGSADAKIDADGLYELGKMIDRIEAKKEALAQRMNTGTEGQMQSYRSQLSIAYKQENILEKYLAFEQSHGGFFDNLTDLVQGIQQTIRELQSNIQFNSKTGTYDMSKLNFTTVTRMQNVLEKALNDNAKTFNFDEYQKTYRGQMWVLMKNGIVDIEATNAYNAAVFGGEMPHESNEAQEEAELLQAVIQSVREGIDPVTGQEISKAQGFSITSGVIFYYAGGGYKGKKIKIPKKWLDRRRNVNRIDFLQSVNIKDFVVKDKHLRNSTAKRARKFDAETSEEANLIVQDALKNGKVKKIEDNGLGSQRQKSYSAIIDTEKNVGTKGESHIKIVYDELNNVWTVYPVPAP